MGSVEFGQYLRRLRVSNGLSQFQLGKLVGVSDRAVSKWENGISMPKSSVVYRLSEVLFVSNDELMSEMYKDNKVKKEKVNK